MESSEEFIKMCKMVKGTYRSCDMVVWIVKEVPYYGGEDTIIVFLTENGDEYALSREKFQLQFEKITDEKERFNLLRQKYRAFLKAQEQKKIKIPKVEVDEIYVKGVEWLESCDRDFDYNTINSDDD